jgi:hypothetical protein
MKVSREVRDMKAEFHRLGVLLRKITAIKQVSAKDNVVENRPIPHS